MRRLPQSWFGSTESADLGLRLRAARRSVLMLDYDGTLAPFKTDRLQATPYAGVEERLALLAGLSNVRLVLISGRPARELQELVGTQPGSKQKFEIWGNHGREYLEADGSYHLFPLNRNQEETVARVKQKITELGFPKAVERKPASLAIHWRGYQAANRDRIRSAVESICAEQLGDGGLQLLPFDGGLELRPAGRTKGTAVLEILAGEESGLPAAYLGDDHTDEDAFTALDGQGFSLLVRSTPRESTARFWIRPPQEMLLFLDNWIESAEGSVSPVFQAVQPQSGRDSRKGGSMTAPHDSLVVVSNRIPISFATVDGQLTVKTGSGGLISALEPLLRDFGGTWIGSAGAEDSPEVHRLLEEAAHGQTYKYAPVFLREEERRNFYLGFSNEVLWPLFHDLQSRCNFEPKFWHYYQRVNRRFAEAAQKVSGPGGLIWIHDYQLMQAGKSLRSLRPDCRLAFFLHIPFPSPDIFAKLPWRKEILEGLLEHDLIGLQTKRDARNLVACLRSFVPSVKIAARSEAHVAIGERRQSLIQAFPISINYRDFVQSASSAPVLRRMQEIHAQSHDIQIALGVDRLDYTKGIPERLKAFRSLLRNYPEFHRRVELIQIVVPSREGIRGYQELKSEVERLVTRVNGEFSAPGWIPINYINRSIPREELIAIYRAADVALITPLKDGMNLVAKEYCASRVENNGVLILSEFAGAAPELRSGAILVNPYDELGVAAALKAALEMPTEQRRRRMLRMRNQIRSADILKWRDRFFTALEDIPGNHPGHRRESARRSIRSEATQAGARQPENSTK